MEPTTYIIDRNYVPEPPIFKLYISVKAEEEPLIPGLKNWGFLRLHENYIVIQHDAKEQGIYRMLEILGGQPEDVVVFGDDTNDLAMFRPEFTKVAMGNACEQLKAKADIIAPANIDDGIWKVCEEQGWFEKIN